MDVSLCFLIHSLGSVSDMIGCSGRSANLIDFVDEGEGGASHFGQAHEVGDGREGAFLRDQRGKL